MLSTYQDNAKYCLACFLLACLLNTYCFSQKASPKERIVHANLFTTEQGLSQNNVSSILKDRNGFIWIGTGDGLNRFDGYTFTTFSHSDKDSTSISNDVIRKLLLDSKGRLWVGTYNGLNMYDGEKENFKIFQHHETESNSISQNTIISAIEDRSQNLWVGTYWGLNKIDLNTFKITHYYHHDDGSGLADNAINTLMEDRNGKIWACTAKGINIIGANGIERTILPNDKPNGLTSELVINIIQDTTGVIYLGTNGGGVVRLQDENDQSFEYFKSNSTGKNSLGSNIISALAIAPDGSLLVGTDGEGIYEHKGNGNFAKLIAHQNSVFAKAAIHSIFIDNQKNYWIGLFGNGLAFISGAPVRFEHYRYFDSKMEQIGKNSILSIAEDQNKKIWIGTDGGGLYKFDPSTKNFTSYQHSTANPNSLSSNVVKSLLVDHHNNLYIGTFAGGLNYLDTKSNTFTHYLHDPTNSKSIATNHVWSLLENRERRIFVGELGGFDEFITSSKQFKNLTIAVESTINKNTASVFALTEDQNGNIWLGTRLAGIHRYDPLNGSFKSFVNISGDPTSFPSNEILSIRTDSEGKLFVGTDNKGLIHFDPESFSSSSVIKNFEERNIPSMLEDKSSNLWFTSYDGLHKYNAANKMILSYTIADGLQGAQYNEGAALRSSSGEFYFGGTNGLNVFLPEKITEDRSKPPVVFTQLSLYHDGVHVNDQTGLLPASITRSKTLTFLPDQNVFSVEFACLDYKFPKKNRYRYYLVGFDQYWNDINESRIATYTNLPPGEYTLKVSATNSDGYWNDEAASIQIIVIPRWYQRLSFQVGSGLFLILVMVSIIHVRTRFLFRQKRKLELMVTARTRTVETQKAEIKDKNEKLEHAYEEVNSANEQLYRVNLNLEKIVEERTNELKVTIRKLIETDAGLATFLYRASHDLRGPVSSLQGLLHLAKSQNHQQELELYLKSMEKTSKGMLRLLGRLSEISVLFSSDPKMEVVHLDEVIQSVKERLQSVLDYEKVKVEFENKTGQSLLCDKTLLTQIIFNIMENSIVFKTTISPFVNCSIHLSNQSLNVQIKDNGIGISPAVLPKVFDMFFRGDEDSKGNGLGLFIAKRAVDLLGGTIQIQSEQFKETVVTVSLPAKH